MNWTFQDRNGENQNLNQERVSNQKAFSQIHIYADGTEGVSTNYDKNPRNKFLDERESTANENNAGNSSLGELVE